MNSAPAGPPGFDRMHPRLRSTALPAPGIGWFRRLGVALIVLILAAPLVRAEEGASAPAKDWKKSLVILDVKRKHYDYFQPWTRPVENLQKFGVVTGAKEVLTTAEGLSDATLLRAQKNGRGAWVVGKVKWIDYHADLALVTVEDDHFWDGLEPAALGKPAGAGTSMQVLRWKTGNLEQFRGEFKQYSVEPARLSFANYAQMEMTCEIDAGGAGAEPVVSGGQLTGLVCAQAGHNCRVIPAAFLRRQLEAHAREHYPGLGYFDFVWQQGQNPGTLKYLGDTDPDHGVVVIDVPAREGAKVIHPRDVILQVEGFDIDTSGDYADPDYGFVLLENLSTRDKWAGEQVRLTLLREGKKMEVNYTIPKVDYSEKLVPDEIFDRPPEYMIVGGLVFEPLSDPYLRSWGADWKRRAPFRLSYYNYQSPSKERPGLVLLSQVLPDPYNLGYQEDRFLVVDKVNGTKVSRLEDLQAAFKRPQNGFHVVEFMEGERVLKIVLDAEGQSDATKRILQRYRIEKDHVFNP